MRLVLADPELSKAAGNIDSGVLALEVHNPDKEKAKRKRNMVRITNTEIMENLG